MARGVLPPLLASSCDRQESSAQVTQVESRVLKSMLPSCLSALHRAVISIQEEKDEGRK